MSENGFLKKKIKVLEVKLKEADFLSL